MKKSKPTLSGLAHIETIISEDVEIVGNINKGGSIRLEGILKGNITTQGNLIVGKNASVQGDIQCENMNVIGKVEGNVRCRHLKIFSGASLLGAVDIVTIAIEDNATFAGNCTRREEDPDADISNTVDDILNITKE
ncbi:MAG: polymer-forming cytoskeletal protein [Eubacteriaceae bacterium]|jgi:cytoskeletal protein CcmA (bactofilin family)|nr:polymer-forming cytoskeletal protein [Eubacteriaceae bacterium]